MRPTFGTNQAAEKINVYYAGTSAIAEGMPLCYEYDTTTSMVGTIASGTKTMTIAEGSQCDGKYRRTVNPTIYNLAWFAGVVAGSAWNGLIGPRWLDIYTPNGAIVPVKTVLTATVTGRTILAINSGTLTFGNPTTDTPYFGSTAGTIDARSVAVAEETITAAGLCLARLDPNMFVYQGGQIGQELHVGYVGTVGTAVNRMNLDFEQTGGQCMALHYKGIVSGIGSNCRRGMFRFETFITGSGATAQTEEVSCVNITTELDQTSTVSSSGGRLYGLHVTLRSRSFNPNLSSSIIAPLALEFIMTKTTTSALDNPPASSCLIYCNTDEAGTTPTYFMQVMGNSGDAVAYQAHTAAAAGGGSLKINISGIGDRYIVLSTAA